MRRRQVLAALAAGLAGALAGCSDPRASLRLTAVDDAALADRYTPEAADLPPPLRRTVVDAVEEGSATAEGTSPPFEPDRPLAHEGSYYELSWEVTDSYEATRYDVRIDYDPESPTPDAGAGAVAYADLPAVDRETLDGLLPPPERYPGGEGYDVGASAVYTDAEAEQSVLVPDQRYDVVVYDGARYPIEVGDGRRTTVQSYRYTAAAVAADDAAMAARIRERYRFELSGLSAAQRRILDAARDDAYREEEPSAAFRNLVGRLRANEAIEADEYGGDWLVRYDGTDYWVDLQTPPDWREGTVARETPAEY